MIARAYRGHNLDAILIRRVLLATLLLLTTLLVLGVMAGAGTLGTGGIRIGATALLTAVPIGKQLLRGK